MTVSDAVLRPVWQETPARWRMLAFYSLVFSENLAMAAGFWVLWPRPRDTLYTILLSNVAAGTVLGES